jgi:acyl-CoA dehydrogenase family protein 9
MSGGNDLPSFSKSLFSGVITEELVFPYPELDKEESENLDIILATLNKYAADYINVREFDEKEEIPEDVINGWKELGFFGLLIPEEYGGYGLSNTSYVRILEAIGGIDGSTALLIGAHQSIGLKGLLLFGTEEQKKKYLPKLATGEMIACYCLTEPGAGSDAGGIKTRAVLDEKRDVYLLNGSKIWITNGGIADFFTVFAKEEIKTPDGKSKDKITAFILTRDMGVKSGKEEQKLGIRSSSTAGLFFENVEVPAQNVLGERGKGFKVAMEILNSGRVGLAGGSVGGSKTALKQILSYVKEREQFGRPLIDFEIIKEKVARISVNIFVAESMVYLTTGMIDNGTIDFSLESAICKVYATDKLWENVNECMQMAGGIGFSKEYPYELFVRDARINTIFEGTNEILRVFIALAGMQERGEYLKKMGKALKDPVKGFGLITDYAVHYMKDRLTTGRIRKVHESLANSKTEFETWAKNLHITTERILIRYGKNIIQKEIIQERLADASIDLFGMIACISRVELDIRKNGVEKVADKIRLCNFYCEEAWRRIRRNILMIDKNADDDILKIADLIKEEGQYPYQII